jgi:hypothetical protein
MAMSLTWKDATDIEEAVYEIRALVSVLGDAACNEMCTPSPDNVGTVLHIIDRRLDAIEHRISDIYKATRNVTREWDADEEVGLPVEDEDGEDDGDEVDEEDDSKAEEDHSGSDSGSSFVGGLKAVLKEEHDDGSATYTITADDDTLKRLFEAFFIRAVIEGLKSVEGKNEEFVSLKKAATELDQFLQVWENSDVLDYDPEVKEKRQALTKALYG